MTDAERTRRAQRRWLVPETVQTSAMDCGPAALRSLLAGHGVTASYGRLREACQTDVDGTSIDALEEAAAALGLDAVQLMIPADFVLLADSTVMPCLAVVTLASGLPHFVVLWRRHASSVVQVMDPATGRRFSSPADLTRRLYVHEQPVPAAAWAEYAHGDAFTRALLTRMRALHVAAEPAQALVDQAGEDPGWRTLAVLDATIRRAGDARNGRRRGRAGIEALLEQAVDDPERVAGGLPPAAWSVRGSDGSADEVVMRGAVLIKVAGIAAEPVDRAALPVELRAALEEPAPQPARELLAAARHEGPVRVGLIVAGMALAGGGLVGEAALLREVVNHQTPQGLWLVVAVAAGLLVLELWLAVAQLAVGRRLEVGLRGALARKLWRLPDRYLRSRPASDMAERAHILHELRLLPLVAGQLVTAISEVAFVAGALIVLDPASAPLAITAAVLVLAVAWVVQFPLREREMRLREHAGALSQVALDALVGLGAVRAHGAEDTVRGAFAERLAQWRDAGRAAARSRAAATGVQALVGTALAVAIVASALPRLEDPGARLLLVFWALTIPLAAERIGLLALQYPLQRATALRLLEPLLAPEQPQASGGPPPPAPPPDPRAGAHVQLRDVDVHAAGTAVLGDITLSLAPGEHVAFVGASGAGKSTICALLLGWATPTRGAVTVDGRPLDRDGVEALRAQTAWLDPGVRLWNRTLADNVLYGRPDADGQALGTALAAAELGAVAARLDASGDALGDNGGLLSGGEGQRVRLARALGRPDARLAILDEPFRGLDHEQRRRLTRLARQHWATATLICATHDVTDTLDYDRVVVIDGGRIVEDGVPATLRATADSRYRALLDAEAALRADMTADAGWRMLHVQDGRVHEQTPPATALPVAADPHRPDRPPQEAPPAAQRSRVGLLTALYVAVQLGRYGLLLGSWALIASHLLDADVDASSVGVWAALLLGTVPLAALASWLEGRIAVGVGERLKRRLLDGALALSPERARREGPARLLGRVLESDAISTLAVTGGLGVLVAVIELTAAMAILAIDPAGRVAAAVLACWLVLTAATAWRYLRRRGVWTQHRLALTEQLLEAIAGQRTRLVQQAAAGRQRAEREALAAYDHVSTGLDRTLAALGEALPRGWLAAALTTLALTVTLSDPGAGQVAAALGASLLAFNALRRAGSGAASLAGAALAYQQMRPLLRPPIPDPPPLAAPHPATPADGPALLVADGVGVTRGARTVLHDAAITVRRGERIVLTGASGAGKSTFAAVLCGLHQPDAGHLSLHTPRPVHHGDPAWRTHVTGVPQYHDNHILLAPLVFNLLIGRSWPPSPQDLADAETCCRDLGLGHTIDRMPAGLQQIVGETGWQLSQGERSLVYIARALLAQPDLLILDENLGPLDPHTARQALRTVLAHAPTVVVISQQ